MPNCRLTTRAEIAIGQIHSADFTAVNRFVTKFFSDSQKLVVFANPVRPAKRTSLYLAGVRRNSDIGNRCVFGFTGTMTDHGCVIILFCQINCSQRFGECADLVDLDQNGIGHVFSDPFAKKLHIRDKQIVADQLNLAAEARSQFLPAIPIVFRATVLDRNNRETRAKIDIYSISSSADFFEPSDFLKM